MSVFRQGCTKATVGVATLSGLLDKLSTSSYPPELPPTFAQKFWSLQTSRVGGLWDQTKAEDYGWETTTPVEGETLEDGKWTRWFTRNLIAVGQKDAAVANVIYGSAMFLAPGTDALHPSVVRKVVWNGIKVCRSCSLHVIHEFTTFIGLFRMDRSPVVTLPSHTEAAGEAQKLTRRFFPWSDHDHFDKTSKSKVHRCITKRGLITHSRSFNSS